MVVNCETNTINMKGMKRSSDELSVLELSSKRKKIENDGVFKEKSFQDLLKNYNIDLEDSGILYGSIDSFFKDSISKWSMKISNCEMESIINQELNTILQHISFKQYFRHNLEIYCNFIRIILTKISSPKEVVIVLQNDLVFYRTLISEKEFRKHFLGIIFPELVNILSKYDDQELYLKVCWIFKKVILDKNFGEFQNYLDNVLKLAENKSDEKFDVPKSLLKTLGKTYNSHVESYPAAKIIFQSIINAYKDFKLIFKFCIAIIELLGLDLSCDFNCKKFSKFSSSDVKLSNSLVVLSKILEILKNSNIDLNCSVVINFSQFIENIVKSILNLTKIPNEACYKILEYSIEIHPLLVEKYLNNLLSYSMFANNTDCEESYLKFLLKIFETYAKLHRIQNLISKMLPVLKSIEENKDYEEYYTFRGNNDLQGIMERRLDAAKVLPDDVLYIFSQYATQMASWQYMNLFKTFIFHLDATVNDFIESNENTHNSFIELLCKFTSWLLRINRMDENTTTPKIMGNFNASMGEVKNILKKLGGALLEREHDQLLVRVFLNISYDWADRHIQFHYYNTGYLNDEGIFSDVNHPNYQYSFLTNEQWILLSQRIMNFGESNSKHLMVKKSKSSAEFKELCSVIKIKILNVNFDAVTTRKADPLLISSYVSCLKHWISIKEEDKLEKLVESNENYLNMVLEMQTDVLPKGSVLLFSTVLLHKQVFKISPKLPLKIWMYCKLKKVDPGEVEDFSQLLCLIFEHIPNDKFELISSDIFNVMVEAINSESYSQLFEHLRTGTFLLNSSLNPVKFEIWLKFLERLMFKLHTLKANISLDQEVLNEIIKFEVAVINRKLLILSPSIMSMLLMSPFTLMKKESNYYQNFNISMSYMESLLKHRSTMIMDRISTYLKVFRRLLFSLCKKCGEIEKNDDFSELENITNCAYQLEKLVGHLVMFKKDMGRIAPHLIGDILYQYETYTLFPKVKVHLNNCMYSLVSVCDNHAVSYLLRGLSSASTELFKIVFNEYKKFHRFTGKV